MIAKTQPPTQPSAEPRIRICVVEDEPSLRVDLVDYLEAHNYAAFGCASAAEFRASLAEQGTPDIVLLDVNLPDGNGFDLARDLRARSTCGIVMLTMRSAADDRVEGLESGADAYLVKHASLREIDATLRSVQRRLESTRPAAVAEPAADTWQFQPVLWQLLTPGGAVVKLTGSEVAFLTALIERAGKPCPRDEIVRMLARPSLRIEDRSIDALVRRLRRKIAEVAGGDVPIKMVYGVGYSFAAPVRSVETPPQG
ncbi:MAG: response regulator transcription factor [Ferrovibrio sp.]|nr:response regulator transcription factor [Ferrovibrio sp.]